jgi:hypothetical protein
VLQCRVQGAGAGYIEQRYSTAQHGVEYITAVQCHIECSGTEDSRRCD